MIFTWSHTLLQLNSQDIMVLYQDLNNISGAWTIKTAFSDSHKFAHPNCTSWFRDSNPQPSVYKAHHPFVIIH